MIGSVWVAGVGRFWPAPVKINPRLPDGLGNSLPNTKGFGKRKQTGGVGAFYFERMIAMDEEKYQKPVVGIGSTVEVSGHIARVTEIRRDGVVMMLPDGRDVEVPREMIELAVSQRA